MQTLTNDRGDMRKLVLLINQDDVAWLDRPDIQPTICRYYGDPAEFIRSYLLDQHYFMGEYGPETKERQASLMEDGLADDVSNVIQSFVDTEELTDEQECDFYMHRGPEDAKILHESFERLTNIMIRQLDTVPLIPTSGYDTCDCDFVVEYNDKASTVEITMSVSDYSEVDPIEEILDDGN